MSIYPSDFGLKQLAHEEHKGPSELLHHGSEDEGVDSCDEGRGYSTEKLRSYQFKRLKWVTFVLHCCYCKVLCVHRLLYSSLQN